MKRQDWINSAIQNGITEINGKSLEDCHTVEIERAVKPKLPRSESGPTIKDRIISLAKEGLTKRAIEQKLLDEGLTRIRYQYIFVVLKDNKIEVPKAVKVKGA